jgi:hypothetical protein
VFGLEARGLLFGPALPFLSGSKFDYHDSGGKPLLIFFCFTAPFLVFAKPVSKTKWENVK